MLLELLFKLLELLLRLLALSLRFLLSLLLPLVLIARLRPDPDRVLVRLVRFGEIRLGPESSSSLSPEAELLALTLRRTGFEGEESPDSSVILVAAAVDAIFATS